MNTNNTTFATISQWFEQAVKADIIFPEGRSGKPFDNPFRLEKISEINGCLILELDGNVVLLFCGRFIARRNDSFLEISDYSHVLYLRFDEREHKIQYVRYYDYGIIRFDADPFSCVPPPGNAKS